MKIFPIILLLAGLAAGACFIRQGGKLHVNSQFVSVTFSRGGYRSYGIVYSDGITLGEDGKTKNLWHRPQFSHLDLRALHKGWRKITNSWDLKELSPPGFSNSTVLQIWDPKTQP